MQIGIVVDQDMKVDPMESDINGINYIVSVGMPNPYRTSDTSVNEYNCFINLQHLRIYLIIEQIR